MTDTMKYSVNGQMVDVPGNELNQFLEAAKQHGAEPDAVRSYRVTQADGSKQTVDVPDSQYGDFSAMAGERGAALEHTRRVSFANGEQRDFTVPELSKFLRSKEWREDGKYQADRDDFAAKAAKRVAPQPNEEDGDGFMGDYLKGLSDEASPIGQTIGGALSRFSKFAGMMAANARPMGTEAALSSREFHPEEQNPDEVKAGTPVRRMQNSVGGALGKEIDKWTAVMFPQERQTDSAVVGAVGKAVGLGAGLAEFALTPTAILAGGHFAEGMDEAFDAAKARGATDEEAATLGVMRGATDAAITTAFKNAPAHRIMKALGYSPAPAMEAAIAKAGEKGIMGVTRGGVATAVGKQMLANAAISASEMGVLGGLQAFIDDAVMQEAEKGTIDWEQSWKTLGQQAVEQGAFGAVMGLLPTPVKVREAVKARDAKLRDVLDDPMGVMAYANANPEAANTVAEAWKRDGAVSRKVARAAGLPEMDAAARNEIGEIMAKMGEEKPVAETPKNATVDASPKTEATTPPEAETSGNGGISAENGAVEVKPAETEPVKPVEAAETATETPAGTASTPETPVEKPKRKVTGAAAHTIAAYSSDENGNSTGALQWHKDNGGRIYNIPVDMANTRPGGKVVLDKTDSAYERIMELLGGNTDNLRMSKNGKVYFTNSKSVPPELRELLGRELNVGKNPDGGVSRDDMHGVFRKQTDYTEGDTVPWNEVEQMVSADREGYAKWKQKQILDGHDRAEEKKMLNAVNRGKMTQEDFDIWKAERDIGRMEEDIKANGLNPEKDPDFIARKRDLEVLKEEGRYPYEEISAAKEKADQEWEGAVGEIESGDPTFGPTSEYNVPLTKENLQKAKTGDIIRPFGAKKEYTLDGYDANTDTMTLAYEGEDGVVRRVKVSFNGVEEVKNDGRSEAGHVEADVADAGGKGNVPAGAVAEEGGRAEAAKPSEARAAEKGSRAEGLTDAETRQQMQERKLAQRLQDQDFKDWAKRQGVAPTKDHLEMYDRTQAKGAAKVVKNWIKGVKTRFISTPSDIPDDARLAIEGIYTGSAADYEKPSLKYIGTGEGTQNEAWGLYGSDAPGIAGRYANQDVVQLPRKAFRNGEEIKYNPKSYFADDPEELYIRFRLNNKKNHAATHDEVVDLIKKNIKYLKEDRLSRFELEPDSREELFMKALEFAEKHGNEIEIKDNEKQKHAYVYEQTFFTNREDGDTSHLIDWNNNVPDTIISTINEKLPDGKSVESGIGRDVYNKIADILGSKKNASEFLRDKCDIDGVVYDSPASEGKWKGVKDYITFRDDNIRVDHKWVDSKKRYLRAKNGDVIGWFDKKSNEVALLPGANAKTVAHEIGWHATYDHAEKLAAKGDTRLLDKLRKYADNAPASVKAEVLAKYGMNSDPAMLIDEIGAARFTADHAMKIKDEAVRRDALKWYGKMWEACKDAYKSMLTKMGFNRASIDAMNAMTPENAVDYMAKAMTEGKNLGKAERAGGIDVNAAETSKQAYVRKMKDYTEPLKWLDEVTGGKFAVHREQKLSHGVKQKAFTDLENYSKEIEAYAKKHDVKASEVNEYMLAKGAADTNRRLKAKTGAENGAGISDADAARTVLTYESNYPKFKHIKHIADIYWKMQDEALTERVDKGLISAQFANDLRTAEPHHVPRHNRMSEDGEFFGYDFDPKTDLSKPEWRAAQGRYSEAGNAIGWIMQEYANAFSRGAENNVRQQLLKAVAANPELGQVVKITPNNRDSLGELTRTKKTGDKRVVIVKNNGDEYAMVLNGTRGELVARAMTERGRVQTPGWMKTAMRAWSSTATEWSPTFALRNLTADLADVLMVNLEHGLKGGLTRDAQHLKGMATLAKDVLKYAKTEKTNNPLIKEAIDNGLLIGGMGNEGYTDPAKMSMKLGDTMDFMHGEYTKFQKMKRKGLNGAKAAGKFMFGWVGVLNKTAELSNRLADYQVCIKNGMSPKDAAAHARDITVDFNEQGEWTAVSNTMYMFSNSTLGAAFRQVRAIFKSPEAFATITGTLFSLGLVEAFSEKAVNGDESEREKKGEATAKDVTEFERANSIMLWRDGATKVRMPFHAGPLSLIKYMGNCAARVMQGQLKAGDAGYEIGKEALGVLTQFMGLGDAGPNVLQTFTPSILQPVVQGAQNVNYAGDPIRKPKFDENKPYSENGRESTPDMYKDIARLFNSIDGNEARKGSIDFAPETYRLIAESIGKNALRDIMGVLDSPKSVGDLIAAFRGEKPLDTRKIPVLRDFMRVNGNGNTSRFYESAGKYDADRYEYINTKGGMTPEERKAYLAEHTMVRRDMVNAAQDVRDARGKLVTYKNAEARINELRKLENGFVKDAKGHWKKRATPPSEEFVARKRAERLRLQAKFLSASEKAEKAKR